jgi:DNA-directed RNA polymerase subunit RPC12/RpoP
MTSVDAIMNRIIDRMGSVPDCEVIQVCIAYNTTERIDADRMGLFVTRLPLRQFGLANLIIESYVCPTCQQAYQSAQAINADGTAHCRCPYCGREW